MKLAANQKSTGRIGRRTLYMCGAVLALSTLGLAFTTGCSDTVIQQFRSAAADQLQTGLQSIMTGVISGIFNVVTPVDSTNGSTSTNGSSTTGS